MYIVKISANIFAFTMDKKGRKMRKKRQKYKSSVVSTHATYKHSNKTIKGK